MMIDDPRAGLVGAAENAARLPVPAFFRNRAFLRTFAQELTQRCPGRCRILFHACSVGADPYSLAIWWLEHVVPAGWPMPLIVATDAEPGFLEAARTGEYPETILRGMRPEERRWFTPVAGARVRVADAVRAHVEFLAPRSFVTAEFREAFDATLLLGALIYVSPPEQSEALARAARYTRHLLGLTAFHPDSLQADLEPAGFLPVLTALAEIREAWDPPLTGAPGDDPWRACTIFARRHAT